MSSYEVSAIEVLRKDKTKRDKQSAQNLSLMRARKHGAN
jgi:hypothetical protein